MFDRDFVVLELANILAGPVTAMFFAELGARVVKIENPLTGGDPTRAWKLSAESADSDVSAYFACTNWGKESLALDLTSAAGQGVAHELAKRADVVIASFKPGDDVKMRLDPATLRALNPRVIYGQITAYGADDTRPGFDAILQAESGFTYLNGEPDGPPTKMPVALIDLLLAHQLKEGLLLALLRRERTGRGDLVATTLLQAGVASLANQATNYLQAGVVPQRMGSEHPNIVPYGTILHCADGVEVVIAAATERQYRQFMGVLDLLPATALPEFATAQLRVRNRTALLALIRERVGTIRGADLTVALTQAKVPFGYVNDMAAVFRQPQVQSLLLGDREAAEGPKGVRSFIAHGAGATVAALSPPPQLNQHAQQVLHEFLGYSPDRVRNLASEGAFGPSDGTRVKTSS